MNPSIAEVDVQAELVRVEEATCGVASE